MIKSENKKVNKSTYLENVKERRVKENKMIFGIRAVLEAIEAGKEFDRILIRRDMNSAIGRELLEATRGKNFPIVRVPQEKLNRLTEKNHQGVIAFLSVTHPGPKCQTDFQFFPYVNYNKYNIYSVCSSN